MIYKYIHKSVLLHDSVNVLNIIPNGKYIDATFGVGGHSKLILSKLNQYGQLLAIDRDPESIKVAKNINDSRFKIKKKKFSQLLIYISKLNLISKINGIIIDLGMSSIQLNDKNRGFSFMHDGILDMRMDNTCGKSASDWLLKANIKDITLVLKNFGEERFAKRIALAIKKNINYSPISTYELVSIIKNNIPFFDKNKHPATRAFQAIRIYINNELEEIKKILNHSLKILAPGGKLSIISFNSLEDRIVKKFIYKNSKKSQLPKGLPITENQINNKYKNIFYFNNFGRIKPSLEEKKKNSRARSAILRYAEKK